MGAIYENMARSKGEVRFSGIAGFCDIPLAVGKMYLWEGTGASHIPDPAIICILDRELVSCAAAYMSLSPPSAVVLGSGAVCSRLLSFLICAKIPYLILKDSTEPLGTCGNRVALLDIKNSLLIVNPQLETLNTYSGIKALLQPHEEIFEEPPTLRIIKEKGNKGLLADASELSSTELLESLLSLVESPFSPPSKVLLDVPKAEDSEGFSESIEALFCASLYGNLSLMLRGYTEKEHITMAFAIMNRVFCRMEEEGREFNGYIKKGLMADAPIWLMQPPPLSYPDFMCFDIDLLISRLFGTNKMKSATEAQELSFCGVWEQYIRCFAPDCPLLIKTKLNAKLLPALSRIYPLSEIYIETR